MLDERRAFYDYFVELYRQNKNHRLTEVEIAITAQYRDRSAVAKYLNGTASGICAQDVERVLNMMPDEFDERRIENRNSSSPEGSRAGRLKNASVKQERGTRKA
jgi:hypothetical protein